MFKPHDIDWDSEKSKRLWDYYASSSAHQSAYFSFQNGAEVARLLRKKTLKSAQRILDFSCGKGDLLAAMLPLLRRDQTAYGVDISLQSVEISNSRLSGQAGFGGAFALSALDASILDPSFDVVIATEVIEHLNDKELSQFLESSRIYLKRGGYLFVSTPFQENLGREKTMCPECGCQFHRWQHMRSWSIETLTDYLESSGFEVVECKNIQWGPFFVRWYFALTRRSGNGIYCIAKKA